MEHLEPAPATEPDFTACATMVMHRVQPTVVRPTPPGPYGTRAEWHTQLHNHHSTQFHMSGNTLALLVLVLSGLTDPKRDM